MTTLKERQKAMQQVYPDRAHFSPVKKRKLLFKKRERERKKKMKRQINSWRTLQKERNYECHLYFPA